MTEKTEALAAAEAALHAAEKFTHGVHTANYKLKAAEMSGDPEQIKTAQTAMAAAIKARDEAGVTERDIDELAQAVLDAKGEAHTETNILPPDHGLRTVDAAQDLAIAISARRRHLIPELEKNLAEAQKADADQKAAHVDACHKRTIAARSEAKA